MPAIILQEVASPTSFGAIIVQLLQRGVAYLLKSLHQEAGDAVLISTYPIHESRFFDFRRFPGRFNPLLQILDRDCQLLVLLLLEVGSLLVEQDRGVYRDRRVVDAANGGVCGRVLFVVGGLVTLCLRRIRDPAHVHLLIANVFLLFDLVVVLLLAADQWWTKE